MLKDTILGYYEPSFFRLHLSTNEKIDNLNILSPENKSVFLHEYVHFLQDITTSFGLINLCNIVNIQKAINDCILQQGSTFNIPLEWGKWHPEVSRIDYSFDAYKGQNHSEFDSFSFITGFRKEPSFVKGMEEKIPYMMIQYVRSGKKDECNFGALAIMESMAFSIQQLLCDYIPSSPEYPYSLVQNLVLHIYPDYASDTLFQIIMCDIALNTYHPGKFLYEMLCRLAKDKFRYNKYEDIYDYANDYLFIDLNQKEYNFESLFIKSANEASDAFMGYFTIPNFAPIKDWGAKLIQNSISLRKSRPNYWIEILDKSTKAERKYEFFKTFMPIFGTPLITNNLNHCTFLNDSGLYDGDVDLLSSLLAIREIQEYVTGRIDHCSLQEFCKSTRVDMSVMNCEKPWDIFLGKDSSKILLCPFTMMLKAWGIYSKKPCFTSNDC